MTNNSMNETFSTENPAEQTISANSHEIAPILAIGSNIPSQSNGPRKFNARHAKGLAVMGAGAGAIGTAICYPDYVLACIKPFAMIGGQIWLINKINTHFGSKGGLAVRMIMSSKTPGLMVAP